MNSHQEIKICFVKLKSRCRFIGYFKRRGTECRLLEILQLALTTSCGLVPWHGVHSYIFTGHSSWQAPDRHNIRRTDSRSAPSQWETSLQSNIVSHWLGANLEPALIQIWVAHGIAPLLLNGMVDPEQWGMSPGGHCWSFYTGTLSSLSLPLQFIWGSGR